MTEKDFKKLLIDLEVQIQEIAADAGISSWAVTKYFRGELRASERRSRIKAFLERRAAEMGMELPEFWTEAAA